MTENDIRGEVYDDLDRFRDPADEPGPEDSWPVRLAIACIYVVAAASLVMALILYVVMIPKAVYDEYVGE